MELMQRAPKLRRVCRRLQLLSNMERHEQDHEQVPAPEVRECAVRMVLDGEGLSGSRWQVIASIAAKIGCSANSLSAWVKKAEVNSDKRVGIPSNMTEKMRALERENRELRQANEIFRKSSAYFAMAELDRRSK